MTLIYHGVQNICQSKFVPILLHFVSKTKRFQSMGKINSFFISVGTVKIKIDENSKPLAITLLDDLTVNFPGVDLFSPPPKASQWRTKRCCVQLLYYILQYFVIFLLSLYFLYVLLESICQTWLRSLHFPAFFLEIDFYIGCLSLIEQVTKQFNLSLCLFIFMILMILLCLKY